MSTKYGGYMGKVLKIDLTVQEASEYPFSDEERELFIGGKTMAAKILGDHLKGTEQAFSKENLLVITTGPLTGQPVQYIDPVAPDRVSHILELRRQFRLLPEKGRIGWADPDRTV